MRKDIRVFYAGIRVRNLAKSIAFYRDAMGMRVTRGTMPHGGKYVGLRSFGSSAEIELNWYPPRSKFYTKYRSGEEMDHIAFLVRNIESAYNRLRSRGVRVAVSPESAKVITEIYLKDPDGIWIELLKW